MVELIKWRRGWWCAASAANTKEISRGDSKVQQWRERKLKQDINTYQIIFIVFYSSLLFSGSVQKIKLDILRKGPPPPQENLRRDSAVFNIFFGIQILTSDINCVPIRVKPQVAYISVSVQSGNFKSDEMFEK